MPFFRWKHLGTALLLCRFAELVTNTFGSSVGEWCYDGLWFTLHGRAGTL